MKTARPGWAVKGGFFWLIQEEVFHFLQNSLPILLNRWDLLRYGKKFYKFVNKKRSCIKKTVE